jgi:hypothetical protein
VVQRRCKGRRSQRESKRVKESQRESKRVKGSQRESKGVKRERVKESHISQELYKNQIFLLRNRLRFAKFSILGYGLKIRRIRNL